MRTPIIAGNWKMHNTIAEGVALASVLAAAAAAGPGAAFAEAGGFGGCEIVLCPPFTAIKSVADAVKGSVIQVGAQDVHWESHGAFTGEVSCTMLLDAGCSWVIIGHSERRAMFGDTDETVNRKVKAALAAGLRTIVCVGESLAQREQGLTHDIVTAQVLAAFNEVSAEAGAKAVVAYEPIWAIGTGRASSAADAQEVCAGLRATLAGVYGSAVASEIRIQYGGSVKPGNMHEFASEADIDGALVGGASLSAADFSGIIRAAVGAKNRR